VIGVYQHRPEHLVVVGGGAIAVVLLPALRAMHVGGGDILGAIE
jgi:pyruvate/2-oxoglutarate dehydrogenase complex dihydrolipoamide dehydrogenase (E3) component